MLANTKVSSTAPTVRIRFIIFKAAHVLPYCVAANTATAFQRVVLKKLCIIHSTPSITQVVS